ncbi:hypothetical protein ACEWY4_026659 [Coilia grayii]|uniref:Neuronal PAS domain-containing protein 4 n=1 Tax=Coilia grayii TaxID=363190 RepID=A0ABD1ISF7_9TELE
MYRSTKGASKARRDQINAEIRNLKDLLPISDVDKARLSYLHIMSLACMYTRKSVFFSKDAPITESPEERSFFSFHELSNLMQEMPGFLLLLTGEGKLLFLSDSVSEHLGHSMVDLVAQGDSVYDIIDPTDHFIMRSNLVPPTTQETDRLFRCRFNTSKSVRRQSAGNKLVLIRARCLSPPVAPTSTGSYWTSNPVWVCFCTPLEPHPPRPGTAPEAEPSRRVATEHNLFLACFYSQHSRDMRLLEVQDSAYDYLGLDAETLRSRSWYSLLHPEDLTHASSQHCSLLREGGEGRAEMVVRVESGDQSWVWLYMVLQLEAGEHPIRSNNFVISESEAWSVRQQLSSEQSQLTLVLGSSSASQQESMSLQSPETLSSPDQVFTPGSSGLSGQSFDFSTAVCSEEQPGSSKAAEASGAEGPRSSLSSLEEESFFQPPAASSSSEPLASPSAASSPIPVTVATVPELDFLTQNILLPPSFQLEPPLPALPLPLPPVPTSQAQQTKELVCTPPYTPQVASGGSFPFGDPLFSFDPSDATTTPPLGALTTTVTTTTAASQSSPSNPPTSPPPPPTTTLSSLLPLTLTMPSSTELLFPGEPCSGTLYEKLPPTPDSPGDGDCTVMNLPEVRGPLYVDVPLVGPLHCPPEGLLTPEASPGKQSYLSFFSLEPELEREKMDIALLAEHIGTLAEGLYPDPLIPKLMPSSSSSSEPPFPTTTLDPVGLDSLFSLLGDFYPIKSWRGLDLPIFPDEDSLFEERILETLLQDLATSPCPSPTPTLSSPSSFSPSPFSSSSSSSSPCSTPSSSPLSPTSPMCWVPSLHFDGASVVGASHFRSVQSARRNQAAGCGAAMELEPECTPTPGDRDDDGKEEEAEVAMETEESPLLSSGVPMSPPQLAPSSVSASPPPVSPAQPGLPCAQSLLEELATLEPMFGAGASITPGLGQQTELYQLQCHPIPQCFHKGELCVGAEFKPLVSC